MLRRQDNLAVLYVYPTLLTVGVVCNTVSFLIIVKSNIIKASTGIYLASLCWADTCALIQWVLFLWRGPIRRPPAFVNSCSVRQFILTVSTHLGGICVIGVTIDRFIAVYFPFKAKIINTRRNASIVLLTVAACILALYVPMLVASNPNCSIKPQYELYMNTIVVITSFVVYTYGPVIVLFCANIAIIIKLQVSSSFKKRAHSRSESSDQNRIIASVLSVSILYVICQLPYTVLLSLRAHAGYRLPPGVLGAILSDGSRMLMVANHAINFFLYILTSKNFKNTMRHAITCCCRGRRFPGATRAISQRASSLAETKQTSISNN